MPDYIASLIRTIVPMIVGWLVTTLQPLGMDIDTATTAAFLTMVLGAVYYAVVRALEAKLGEKWGWLLGLARSPEYKPPAT